MTKAMIVRKQNAANPGKFQMPGAFLEQFGFFGSRLDHLIQGKPSFAQMVITCLVRFWLSQP